MIRLITWDRVNAYLEAFGAFVPCSCPVRTLADGTRPRDLIAYTVPNHLPYDPARFPCGTWTVGKPEAETDPYKAPWYIPTDAVQEVEIWRVENGRYARPWLEKFVLDSAYGLHCSENDYTLGCIKIARREDVEWMVDRIEEFAARGDVVKIKVTENGV